MICPCCNKPDVTQPDDGRWPTCEECGFVIYSAESLALQAEVRAEYEQAKRECWPEPVPEYLEYLRRR
jgi:hypothetical protein